MKIVKQEGCICDCLTINGIEESNMTNIQRKGYFDEIVDHLKELTPNNEDIWFNTFLQWFCNNYGVYSCSDEPCEMCGDYVVKHEIDL